MSIKQLFGKNISPSCDYCRYSFQKDSGIVICSSGNSAGIHGACRKYEYDPLKREPRTLPPMPQFTADDFKL